MSKSKSRPVLLDKTIKAVLAFVSRDETRAVLTGVHITPEYAEATNSYRLVRMTHPTGPDPMDFPCKPGTSERPIADIPEEGILVPATAIKKALKDMPAKGNTLPILNRLAIQPDGEYISFTTTDLNTTAVHTALKIHGDFPSIDKLLGTYAGENEPDGVVSFNPTLLKETAQAFEAFGAKVVTLECRGALKPALLKAENSAGQSMTALLMPVRMG